MQELSVREILDYINTTGYQYSFHGNVDTRVRGFSSLENYKEGCLTWIKRQDNWREEYEDYKIPLLFVQAGCEIEVSNRVVSSDSRNIFFSVVAHFYGGKEAEPGIGQYTVMGENVRLDENVSIGNHCSLVGDIHVGAGTVIEDNVVIRNRVAIGQNCHIQSGCVLGEDGFGYVEGASHKKTMIRHFGGLVIGNDVFVGMHTNIARGVLDDTVIGDGVKIAPTSHIGHNNRIDDDAIFICSQSYGSAHIGRDAYVVGSIVRNHCAVGSQSMVGMGSVVTKDIPENKVAIGAPARVVGDRYEEG